MSGRPRDLQGAGVITVARMLVLIAAGKSNRQIAKELFVAQSTVKTHIKNIYGKLDAHTRTQAIARAKELGLL